MDAFDSFLLLTLILTIVADSSVFSESLKASACYGNTNNFLELSCKTGEIIQVNEVLYGAKLKSDNCPVPTVNNDHPASCCYYINTTDCAFTRPQGPGAQPDPYITLCDGKQNCTMRTTWQDTTGHCVDKFMTLTNFMELTYICVPSPNNVAASPSSTTSPSILTTTSSTTSTTTSSTTSTTSTTTATTKPTTTTRTTRKEQIEAARTNQPQTRHTGSNPNLSHSRSHTEAKSTIPSTNSPTTPTSSSSSSLSSSESSSSSPAPGRHVEVDVSFTTTQKSPEDYTSSFAFTTGMMGGMVAAIIGLMLTIFGFLFYWGRRKRKLTTMKPNNSTVWDFLLAHTVAARTFRRGYDNFSNNRDSVSSETDVTHGKQTWLPNIRVEPGMDTMSVTSDENCSIVNISTLDSGNATISSRHDRSEV